MKSSWQSHIAWQPTPWAAGRNRPDPPRTPYPIAADRARAPQPFRPDLRVVRARLSVRYVGVRQVGRSGLR